MYICRRDDAYAPPDFHLSFSVYGKPVDLPVPDMSSLGLDVSISQLRRLTLKVLDAKTSAPRSQIRLYLKGRLDDALTVGTQSPIHRLKLLAYLVIYFHYPKYYSRY